MKTQETIKERARAAQKRRNYFVDSNKYVIVHVDGRSFSKMTKKFFKKPFDDGFNKMMDETAKYLCENVQGAKIAYVQSDEITLILKKDREESYIFFNGRLCKMQSIIASMATSKFNRLMIRHMLRHAEEYYEDHLFAMSFILSDVIDSTPLCHFDCKVWDVDTPNDAFVWFLYRNIDCTKNSKQQFAQSRIPHSELTGLNTDDQIELMKERTGLDWNDLPQGQKYGRFIDKTVVDEQSVTNDGEIVSCLRTKWSVKPALNLTNEEQRKTFLDYYNFFKNER